MGIFNDGMYTEEEVEKIEEIPKLGDFIYYEEDFKLMKKYRVVGVKWIERAEGHGYWDCKIEEVEEEE